MLPLRPPPRPVDPGYPTRDRILGDRTLRRQALGVLAAAVLTGCAGDPPAQPPQPAGETPVPAATPKPNRLPGEASAPTPPPAPPAKPLDEPQPAPLGGVIAVPPSPEPAPLRGDVVTPQQPEPAPLRGKVISDPLPPEPVK